VVVFKFQKAAYDFWYYFPGSYDFSGSEVKPCAKSDKQCGTDSLEQLKDLQWGRSQAMQCEANLKLPTDFVQRVLKRIVPEG
jgi:hypothetical protein